MYKSSFYNDVNTRARYHSGPASFVVALGSVLALMLLASGAQAADSKGAASEESRQGIGGVQIESVIGSTERAPTLELLQEGFTIECSSRFESGCKLFLKGN